jgi:hypothetical protein
MLLRFRGEEVTVLGCNNTARASKGRRLQVIQSFLEDSHMEYTTA